MYIGDSLRESAARKRVVWATTHTVASAFTRHDVDNRIELTLGRNDVHDMWNARTLLADCNAVHACTELQEKRPRFRAGQFDARIRAYSSSHLQGRLNLWAHWAPAQGPRIFLFLSDPNSLWWSKFFKLIILLLMLLHDRTKTSTVHIWST